MTVQRINKLIWNNYLTDMLYKMRLHPNLSLHREPIQSLHKVCPCLYTASRQTLPQLFSHRGELLNFYLNQSFFTLPVMIYVNHSKTVLYQYYYLHKITYVAVLGCEFQPRTAFEAL